MGTRSPAGSIWFQGDWSDPWVVGLADALPRLAELHRLDASAGFPRTAAPPELLIVHRPRLLPRDAERFAAWKASSDWTRFPATILCYGPFARYAEMDRWLSMVDETIPEATAGDSLPRRVERIFDPDRVEAIPPRDDSAQVVVVSTNGDLRRALGDLCAEWVPRVVALPDIRPELASSLGRGAVEAESGPTVTILDVPLLEPGWESRIERASRWGAVIALLGFPDRSTVESARRSGASACLEIPFDRDDLQFALSRCVKLSRQARKGPHAGFEPGHLLPRPPSSSRVARPSRAPRRDA